MSIKLNIISVLLVLGVIHARAQGVDEKIAVTEVITRLFNGMEAGDSAMVHSTFTSDVTFATIFRDGNNVQQLQRENSSSDFLKAVGTPHKNIWYEEIWGVTIQVDGDFAQAWCNYAFYLGNTFSHCGIDAFQLYKETQGWKIFQLADTRRKDGCITPASIQAKHK